MMDFEFLEDTNACYGFTINPKDKKSFRKTEYQLHLDTFYIRFSIWTYDRCIQYLFDKNKNLISWEQRQKECENFPIEEQIFEDDYKVVRTREVKVCNDEYKDGREYVVDTLYQNNEFQTSKTEIDLFPINKIYNEWIEYIKHKDEYKLKRETNQTLYLDPNTLKTLRIKILYEEVAYDVAILAYHPMVRDSEQLVNMADYEEYEKLYYSKVPNKQENYIEYLKAYCEGLRESAIDDIEGEDELEFIKKKCKEAKLQNIFLEKNSVFK